MKGPLPVGKRGHLHNCTGISLSCRFGVRIRHRGRVSEFVWRMHIFSECDIDDDGIAEPFGRIVDATLCESLAP